MSSLTAWMLSTCIRTSYFYLFDTCRVCSHFWRLLIVETTLVHHVVCTIRVLIRVSEFIIDISVWSSSTLRNSWIIGHSYVSEWLRHITVRNILCWFTCSIIWISQKVSMMTALSTWHLSWHHGCCILVCNCVLSSLHFLILDEIFMSSRSMLDIWIVSAVARRLNLILQLFVAHCDHWSWSISSILLTWSSRGSRCIPISLSTDKNNIALVYSCIVWGAMWSLFVISSELSPAYWSLITIWNSTNWISTNVLRRLSECE